MSILQNMGYVFTGLMQAAGASEKVFEYIDRAPLIRNDGKINSTIRGRIEFRDVSFCYPTRPDQQILQVHLLHCIILTNIII